MLNAVRVNLEREGIVHQHHIDFRPPIDSKALRIKLLKVRSSPIVLSVLTLL